MGNVRDDRYVAGHFPWLGIYAHLFETSDAGVDGFCVSWSHTDRACFGRCGGKKRFVSECRLMESFDSGAGVGTVVFSNMDG